MSCHLYTVFIALRFTQGKLFHSCLSRISSRETSLKVRVSARNSKYAMATQLNANRHWANDSLCENNSRLPPNFRYQKNFKSARFYPVNVKRIKMQREPTSAGGIRYDSNKFCSIHKTVPLWYNAIENTTFNVQLFSNNSLKIVVFKETVLQLQAFLYQCGLTRHSESEKYWEM